MKPVALIALVAYAASVALANALITYVGLVPVGLGLMAPAGVFAAGATLALRDYVQEAAGRRWAAAAILSGALVSALLSPQLALASGGAFLVSELLDMLVYTPLRRRSVYAALLASNAVGLVVDSALFLWLAFGSLDFLAGQIVGKTEMTLLAAAALFAWRSARPAAASHPREPRRA